MRGSFKTNETKKKEEECGALLCRTQPYFSFKTIWLFALQSANCFFFLFSSLPGVQSGVLFPTRSLSMLSFAAVRFFCLVLFGFFLCPCCGHLLFSSSTSCHYLTLLLYLCITLVSGKQRCHCGSILSAQRVADGRNLCRL